MEPADFVTVAAILLAYIVIVAKLLQLFCQGRVVAAVSIAAKSCRNWWRNDQAPENESDSEIRRKTEALLNERRVRISRHVGWVYVVTGVLTSLEPILRAFHMMPAASSSALAARLPLELLLLLVSCSLTFPGYMSRRHALPVLYWTSMLILCWLAFALGGVDDDSFMLSTAFLMVRSTMLGGLFLNATSFSIANLFVGMCSIAGYMSTPHPAEIGLPVLVFVHVLIFAVKVAVLFVACWALKWSTKREVEAQLGKCQKSAVMKLLDMMCDAVVDLDSQMKLKSHSLKLAGTLMHHAGRSLHGVPITDFIGGSEDQTHFYESMLADTTTSDDGGPTPGLFTTRFRDALNNHVKFAVFHVPYRSVSGDWNHLVGLREDSDTEPPCALQQTRSDANVGLTVAGAASCQDNLLPQACLREDLVSQLYPESDLCPVAAQWAPQQADTCTISSKSDTCSISKESTRSNQGNLVVEVSLEEGLPIKLFTRSFRDTFGMHGDSPSLKDVLVGGKGKEFLAWLTKNSRLVLEGRSPAAVLSFSRLTLSAPSIAGQQGWREYNAKVSFPKPPKNTSIKDYRIGIKLHSSRPRGLSTLQRIEAPLRNEVEPPQQADAHKIDSSVMCL